MPMQRLWRFLFLLSFFAVPIAAQTTTIRGRVTLPEGDALPGPDQLLVMLNGKRRHASALVNANNTVGRGSSGVDLNAIPASAIQNIEILRDGAAAQYGSDAIAGVINLVLKSDPQPLRVDAKTGQTTHGDGEMLDTSLNGGWGIGKGVLFFTGEYRVRYDTNRASPDPRDQVVAGDAGKNAVAQPNTHWGDSYE